MKCNEKRIRETIETLAGFNATPGEGVTRFSYSSQDAQARAYLMDKMKQAGLTVNVDGVGNIRGRMAGKQDGACIMSGSHIDSVLHGGRLDGIVGSVGALEAVTVLHENGIVPEKPIEVIFFAEEEGSNFDSTMAGSKALVGKYTVEDMKRITGHDGRSMYETVCDAGYAPETMPEQVLKAGDVDTMLELHIEQGEVLESKNLSLGVVTGIFGSKCLEISITGKPNHAGATPMPLRSDAMVAAARIICAVTEETPRIGDTLVTTFGRVQCEPGISNCIAGHVVMTLDVRDIHQHTIDALQEKLEALCKAECAASGVQIEIRLLAAS